MRIAFFDFDGTLTKRDTLRGFTLYAFGYLRYYIGLITLIPTFLLFIGGFINNPEVRKRFIKKFYKNKDLNNLKRLAELYCNEIVPHILNQDTYKQFRFHVEHKHEVAIVSASPNLWLKYWCNLHGVYLISTELEVNNGFTTGNLLGKQCYGKNKVNKIKEIYNLEDYTRIYAYGDSESDMHMIDMADEGYFKGKPFFKQHSGGLYE